MKTVYAASAGAYSDYGIYAIFESEPDAKQYVDRRNTQLYGDFYVEEFKLYQTGEAPPLNHRFKAVANAKQPDIVLTEEWHDGEVPDAQGYTLEPTLSQPRWWYVETTGKNKERVLKAAHDRVAQAKALAEGIT